MKIETKCVDPNSEDVRTGVGSLLSSDVRNMSCESYCATKNDPLMIHSNILVD